MNNQLKSIRSLTYENNILLSVVIPTLHEFENLRWLIPQIASVLEKKLTSHQYEILIVDDEAEQKTKLLIEQLQQDINITYLPHHERRGLENSAIEGFKKAQGQVLLLMDGDGSHQAFDIFSLVTPILEGKTNVTVGSRYISGGKIENWTLSRRLISKLCALIAIPVTGINDAGSGFFAFKKDYIDMNEVESQSWKVGLELHSRNYKETIEVPITFIDRKHGKSKLTSKEGWKYIKHLSKLYINHYLRYNKNHANSKQS